MSQSAWIKFYWAEWLSDANLRRCSLAARGFWMDLQSIAAQSEPKGYVATGDAPLDNADISRICGVAVRDVESLIRELQRNRVLSCDERGRIYAPRMVHDAQQRLRAKSFGARGGNPALLADRIVEAKDKVLPTAREDGEG